jgi:hypothetical protein
MSKKTVNRFNARIFSFMKRTNSYNVALLASSGITINNPNNNDNNNDNNDNNDNNNDNNTIDYSSYIIDY